MILRETYMKKLRGFMDELDMSRDGIVHKNMREFLLSDSF